MVDPLMRKQDIKRFPEKDLLTINQLWLAASEKRFGFSVQKQIWIDLGGKPGQYDRTVFNRYLEKVEWGENNNICFELRAAKGHLPLGMYYYVDGQGSNRRSIHRKWELERDKMRREETRQLELEKERLERKNREIEEKLQEYYYRYAGGVVYGVYHLSGGETKEVKKKNVMCNKEERDLYPFFLSRQEL